MAENIDAVSGSSGSIQRLELEHRGWEKDGLTPALIAEMNRQRTTGESCDVTLVVGGERIPVMVGETEMTKAMEEMEVTEAMKAMEGMEVKKATKITEVQKAMEETEATEVKGVTKEMKAMKMTEGQKVTDATEATKVKKATKMTGQKVTEATEEKEAQKVTEETEATEATEVIEIPAHKLVLSSFSSYFKGLLKPTMKEGHQDRIEIPHLNGEAVKQLIDFAYTGKPQISAENVQSIFEAAHFLAIDSVFVRCCDFLCKNMDESNCVGVLGLADLYSQQELRNAALKKCRYKFSVIAKQEEFYELPVGIVRDILTGEFLPMKGLDYIQREKFILETVVKYIQRNQLGDKSEAVMLFETVRLPLLKKMDVKELAMSELVLGNEELKELVQYRSLVRARKMYEKNDYVEVWMRPRLHKGLKVMESIRYGGWTETYPHDEIRYATDLEQSQNSYICGMIIVVRPKSLSNGTCIAGVAVQYANGEKTSHGCRPLPVTDPPTPQPRTGTREHVVTLSRDERIVGVSLRTGSSCVTGLSFTTSLQRHLGPFGEGEEEGEEGKRKEGKGKEGKGEWVRRGMGVNKRTGPENKRTGVENKRLAPERRVQSPSPNQHGYLQYILTATSFNANSGGYALRSIQFFFAYYDCE